MLFICYGGGVKMRELDENTEQYFRLGQFARLLTQISPFGFYYFVDTAGRETTVFVKDNFGDVYEVLTDELWERVVDGNEYLVNVSVDFFKDSGDRLDIIETDYKTYWIIKKEKRMCKTDIYNYAVKVLGLTPDRFGVYDGETKIQIRVEDWKK